MHNPYVSSRNTYTTELISDNTRPHGVMIVIQKINNCKNHPIRTKDQPKLVERHLGRSCNFI